MCQFVVHNNTDKIWSWFGTRSGYLKLKFSFYCEKNQYMYMVCYIHRFVCLLVASAYITITLLHITYLSTHIHIHSLNSIYNSTFRVLFLSVLKDMTILSFYSMMNFIIFILTSSLMPSSNKSYDAYTNL